jgi:hypothetical protein
MYLNGVEVLLEVVALNDAQRLALAHNGDRRVVLV